VRGLSAREAAAGAAAALRAASLDQAVALGNAVLSGEGTHESGQALHGLGSAIA